MAFGSKPPGQMFIASIPSLVGRAKSPAAKSRMGGSPAATVDSPRRSAHTARVATAGGGGDVRAHKSPSREHGARHKSPHRRQLAKEPDIMDEESSPTLERRVGFSGGKPSRKAYTPPSTDDEDSSPRPNPRVVVKPTSRRGASNHSDESKIAVVEQRIMLKMERMFSDFVEVVKSQVKGQTTSANSKKPSKWHKLPAEEVFSTETSSSDDDDQRAVVPYSRRAASGGESARAGSSRSSHSSRSDERSAARQPKLVSMDECKAKAKEESGGSAKSTSSVVCRNKLVPEMSKIDRIMERSVFFKDTPKATLFQCCAKWCIAAADYNRDVAEVLYKCIMAQYCNSKAQQVFAETNRKIIEDQLRIAARGFIDDHPTFKVNENRNSKAGEKSLADVSDNPRMFVDAFIKSFNP